MKLKSVEFIDCPIFGSVRFDFTDHNGRAVDTIIIAGENGTGKTMLLETIQDHCIPVKETNLGQRIIFEYEMLRSETDKFIQNGIKIKFKEINTVQVKVEHTFTGQVRGSRFEYFVNDQKLGSDFNIFAAVLNELRPVFYLPAEINFKSVPVTTITNQDIDSGFTKEQIRDGNIATLVRQVLVNIEALDAIEFSKWMKQAHRDKLDYSKMDKRMRRFDWAFSYMFPNKKFKEIRTIEQTKKVIFEENGKEVDIDQLSSGEKQIIFRGGYVLLNLGNLNGSVFLIDEPEISLHPKWQLKIVDFYKNIFSDIDGRQTSQIFVTTHSPFILHNYLRKNDRVVIIKRDAAGVIQLNAKDFFFGWTNERIVEEAFNIKFAVVERGTVFVEGETDELYLKKAIELNSADHFPFEIKWVGRVDERGGVQFTGDTALNHLYAFLLANPTFVKAPIILLYDNDTSKQNDRFGDLIIETMPLYADKRYKKGIENLLNLPAQFDYDRFYTATNKVDDYGAPSTIMKLDKKTLCDYLCSESDTEVFQDIYKYIQSLKGKYC